MRRDEKERIVQNGEREKRSQETGTCRPQDELGGKLLTGVTDPWETYSRNQTRRGKTEIDGKTQTEDGRTKCDGKRTPFLTGVVKTKR